LYGFETAHNITVKLMSTDMKISRNMTAYNLTSMMHNVKNVFSFADYHLID